MRLLRQHLSRQELQHHNRLRSHGPIHLQRRHTRPNGRPRRTESIHRYQLHRSPSLFPPRPTRLLPPVRSIKHQSEMGKMLPSRLWSFRSAQDISQSNSLDPFDSLRSSGSPRCTGYPGDWDCDGTAVGDSRRLGEWCKDI